MKYDEIMPECYIDSTLISTLLGGEVAHEHSCNKIARKMDHGVYSDSFAIGIIDNDKRQPTYTKEFEELASTDNLIFLKHRTKNQYLVKVGKPHKAMETFLIENVKSLGKKMEDYGLPSDLKELLRITKNSITTQKDPRILRLSKALRNSPEVKKLQDVLFYLFEMKHNADPEVVKNIVNEP